MANEAFTNKQWRKISHLADDLSRIEWSKLDKHKARYALVV